MPASPHQEAGPVWAGHGTVVLQAGQKVRVHPVPVQPRRPHPGTDRRPKHLPVARIRHHPASLDARVGHYRSLLAGRRVLVLLDNARRAAQVRPLLPGASGCLALVTSRHPLSSLVSREGADRLVPGRLSTAESRSLLARRLDAALAPEVAEAIIARCGGLPLALAAVAARALPGPA